MAHALVNAAGPFETPLASRSYDANDLRYRLAEQNIKSVRPAKLRREYPASHDPVASLKRDAVERL